MQVDQIYHLACPASPVHYKYNPVKTIKVRGREAPPRYRSLSGALCIAPLAAYIPTCKRSSRMQRWLTL